jgi:hypothetical protein
MALQVSQVGEVPDRSDVKALSRRALFRLLIKEQYTLQPKKVTKNRPYQTSDSTMTGFKRSNEVSEMWPITMPTILGAANKFLTGSDKYVTYIWHTIPVRLQPINKSHTLGTRYPSGCSRSLSRIHLAHDTCHAAAVQLVAHACRYIRLLLKWILLVRLERSAAKVRYVCLYTHTCNSTRTTERLFVTFNNDECTKICR